MRGLTKSTSAPEAMRLPSIQGIGRPSQTASPPPVAPSESITHVVRRNAVENRPIAPSYADARGEAIRAWHGLGAA
ncbi:hypothetical protein GCM10011324_10510 [Allosediminivita pacifica]|nr:hypothetical protein GCM10011324_10510 [Allosediminivita pacifica]